MNEFYTLAIIRPHVVIARKAGEIISIAEAVFNIAALARYNLSAYLLRDLYREHEGKWFFERLIASMTEGPSIVMRLEADDAVQQWRSMIGDTDPQKANPGTIRNKYGTQLPYNAVHGSSDHDAARRECLLFAV